MINIKALGDWDPTSTHEQALAALSREVQRQAQQLLDQERAIHRMRIALVDITFTCVLVTVLAALTVLAVVVVATH
jgi:CHASE3 domain sensor protein